MSPPFKHKVASKLTFIWGIAGTTELLTRTPFKTGEAGRFTDGDSRLVDG